MERMLAKSEADNEAWRRACDVLNERTQKMYTDVLEQVRMYACTNVRMYVCGRYTLNVLHDKLHEIFMYVA
jgi:hypothetical protein